MKIGKRILKVAVVLVGAILVLVILFVGYLTVVEYRPEAQEELSVEEIGNKPIKLDQPLKALTFNIGYGCLGEEQDFFMDGGTMVAPENKDSVERNLEGITAILEREQADFYLLQETDIHSSRSFRINESALLGEAFQMNRAFAYNYNCTFVPYPLPMIGHVESGLTTLSGSLPESASRISLPVPFSWPVRLANLKRCLLVERFPVEGSNRELVVINLHLEAYDSGEGKAEQTRMLRQLFEEECGKGNYVLAGGDFNQSFPGMDEVYPLLEAEYWAPGMLYQEDFEGVGTLTFDASAPTCRLLNGPYDPKTAQYYCIDGFIVSNNIQVEQVETLEEDFKYADHNPVKLIFQLEP